MRKLNACLRNVYVNIETQIQFKEQRENVISCLKQCEVEAIAGRKEEFHTAWETLQRQMGNFLSLAHQG